MISSYYLPVPALLVLLWLRGIVRRLRAHSISQLPGPPPGPWLVGNLPDLIRPESAAEAELAWTDKYGPAMRIKGAWGTDALFTADPTALQYILNTAGHHFGKTQQNRATVRLVTGEGLVFAEGHQHTTQRKIMNPGFSYGALKVFLPLFRSTAQRTVSKWKEGMFKYGSTSMVLDIPDWMARTTLDALGQAAFDYEFGAIDKKDNELANAYSGLFADSFFNRSDALIAFEALWEFIPFQLVKRLEMLPTKQLSRLGEYMKVARSVAKNIVDTQTQSLSIGKDGGKDIMSILIRANMSEDSRTKMGEGEIIAQLTTLMLAGHETTSSTLCWALYELAMHPEFQRLIREEIRETRAQASQRGDGEMTIADLDSMHNMSALLKETLRYHPILTTLHRETLADEIIPLSTPQKTKTGETITAVPVSKGQKITMSIAAYHRLVSVWGEDADAWRPQRFLEGVESSQKNSIGVFGNIATFSSGARSCIGFRTIELQAILIELLENFEFSSSPGNPEIVKGASQIVVPM
ncbi:cytochrome P450 [Gautieria morchelliformis]|nr:cytochrome P450 [Gautieria morchelliformis]